MTDFEQGHGLPQPWRERGWDAYCQEGPHHALWKQAHFHALRDVRFHPPSQKTGSYKQESPLHLTFIGGTLQGSLPSYEGITFERAWEDEALEALLEEHHAFVGLNLACTQESLLIRVHHTIRDPLCLSFITDNTGNVPLATHPLVLCVMEPHSDMVLFEQYTGQTSSSTLTNSVLALHLAQGAKCQHYKLQHEGLSTLHLAHSFVSLGQKSQYEHTVVQVGGRLAAHTLTCDLKGEEAQAVSRGVSFARRDQHINTTVLMRHTCVGGQSQQFQRTLADNSAQGVSFSQTTLSEKAQKTKAQQSLHGLLLSEKASVSVQPELKIYADDVQCQHGATVGHINLDHVFYLRSRGLSEEEARRLIIKGYLLDTLGEHIPQTLQGALEGALMEVLYDDKG